MAIKIVITDEGRKVEKILLNARKTIDGNIIISDHPDMNILIIPAKNKIVALPKGELDDELYDSQKRLFDYLFKKGVIISFTSLFILVLHIIYDIFPIQDNRFLYALYINYNQLSCQSKILVVCYNHSP